MKMLDSIALIMGITLMYSAPLIYTALGGVISERSGVVNIGLEGLMTFGAFVGATVGYYSHSPWLAFLAAGIASGFLALFHAIASVTFNANQVVSGVAINFIGSGLSLFLSRLFFEGATMTKPIDLKDKMPKPFDALIHSLGVKNSFFTQVINQYITVYIAFILVFILWFVLYKTKTGLRIRSVGEHPTAADTLGINVYAIRYACVIMSGVLSGLGGAAMSLAVVSLFSPTIISGQGFIALAAVIFGNWKPQGAMWACLLFGGAQGLAVFLGGGKIGIPSQILAMLPYVITLVVLVVFVGKSNAPKADGVPYEKGKR